MYLCVILAGAAWTDLVSGKVRNRWIFSGMLIGILFRKSEFLVSAAIVLIPAFFLWHLGMMGAGDGKLMALIAGFLGVFRGTIAIWTGLCIGAVWSICRFRHDRSFRARLNYLFAYIMRMFSQQGIVKYDDWSEKGSENRHRIPLAVCLAAGVYVYLFLEYFF